MKRIAFLMMAMLLMTGVVMAQGGRRDGNKQMDPKQRAERMTERMVKEYSLNDTQKQQLQEANLALVQKMGGQRQKDGDGKAEKMSQEDREKMRKEMKEVRDNYDNQLKQILTKEQYDTYVKKQAERESKMKNRARGDKQQ